MKVWNSWVGDTFNLAPACLYDEAYAWSIASLATGDPLPLSIIFSPATQQLSGASATSGIYTIQVQIKTLPYKQYTLTSTFNMIIHNGSPFTIGPIANQIFLVGFPIQFQFDWTKVFKDPESDQLIFSAQLDDGGKLGLPSWLMFYTLNQTFVGFPDRT